MFDKKLNLFFSAVQCSGCLSGRIQRVVIGSKGCIGNLIRSTLAAVGCLAPCVVLPVHQRQANQVSGMSNATARQKFLSGTLSLSLSLSLETLSCSMPNKVKARAHTTFRFFSLFFFFFFATDKRQHIVLFLTTLTGSFLSRTGPPILAGSLLSRTGSSMFLTG